jgi:hypothetical protein
MPFLNIIIPNYRFRLEKLDTMKTSNYFLFLIRITLLNRRNTANVVLILDTLQSDQ